MMPSSITVLVFVTATLMLAQGARGREMERMPAVYRNWPSCKRGREFVAVVKQQDRRPGETYHERVSKTGLVKTYLCLPCTECASGVREDKPCSVHHDTECSATECELKACVFDDILHSCRLPGDPNDFPSMAAMMDPCDLKKASTTSSPTRDQPVLDSSTAGSPQAVVTNNSPYADKTSRLQELPPGESFSTDWSTKRLSPLHEALLFVIAVSAISTFVVIVFVVAVVCYRSRGGSLGRGNDHNWIRSSG